MTGIRILIQDVHQSKRIMGSPIWVFQATDKTSSVWCLRSRRLSNYLSYS